MARPHLFRSAILTQRGLASLCHFSYVIYRYLFQNLLAVLDIEALLWFALDAATLQIVDGRILCRR